MMFPTLHLNGTDGATLVEELEAACCALRAAQAALAYAAPNGRDYYQQGPNAAQKARAEHGARLARLQSVKLELEAILESVVDQQDARVRR